MIFKNFNKRSLFTLLLLFLTVFVYGLNESTQREVNLFDYPIRVTTDNASNGGTSSGFAEFNDDGSLGFECLLTETYEWRFCELQFELANIYGSGMDMQQFNLMTLDVSFEVNGFEEQKQPVRMYFKNLVNSGKLKPSSIEFTPSDYQGSVAIPLEYLKVPDWWRLENRVSLREGQSDVRNVTEISFSTPANAQPGMYQLLLNSATVSGPWIAYDTLTNILLIVWLTHGISNLIYSFRETWRENLLLSWEYKQLKNENSLLVNLAHNDKLTGALNRHGAHKVIFEQTPSNTAISIIYLDIDHFKSINDTYSHQAGDAILIMLASLIESSIDEQHRLVRWGGEEFVILCTDISAHGAAKIARRLQERFEEMDWPHVHNVTCSFGIATCKTYEQFNQAIERADHALYRAKANGRNRVEIAPQDV